MKKILLLLFFVPFILLLGTELPAPRNLSAMSDLDGMIPLSWDPPPPLPVDLTEIIYDDNVPVGFDEGGYGTTITQRFEPHSACTVYGFNIKYYMTGTHPATNLKVEVYLYPDVHGGPDVFSALAREDTAFAPVSGWLTYMFEEPIPIDGDFHIGIKKVDSLLRRPTTMFGIFVDEAPSSTPSRASVVEGGYRDPIDGDLFIRALVRYPGDGLFRPTPTTEEKFSYIRGELPLFRPFSSASVDSFKIMRAEAPNGIYRELTRVGDVGTYTDTTTVNHRSYYYKVQARFSGRGWGAFSDSTYGMSRSGPGITIYDTLKYDVGTELGGATWYPRYRFSMKHHAPTTALLYRLLFHFERDGGEFKPAVYNYHRGLPTTDSVYVWPFSVPAREGWNSHNIHHADIYVDGDFVISCNITHSDLAMSWGFPTMPGVAFDYDFPSRSWYSVPDTAYFIRAVIKYSTDVWNIKLHRGWNMVSMPLWPDIEPTPENLFPTMVESGFWYNPVISAYENVEVDDTLKPGYGYWILSRKDTAYAITGSVPIYNYDTQLQSGWNMIGAVAGYPNVSLDHSLQFPDSSRHMIITTVDSTDSGVVRDTSFVVLPTMALDVVFWYDPINRNYGHGTNKMSAGKGYWVLMYDESIFRVDSRRLMRVID